MSLSYLSKEGINTLSWQEAYTHPIVDIDDVNAELFLLGHRGRPRL